MKTATFSFFACTLAAALLASQVSAYTTNWFIYWSEELREEIAGYVYGFSYNEGDDDLCWAAYNSHVGFEENDCKSSTTAPRRRQANKLPHNSLSLFFYSIASGSSQGRLWNALETSAKSYSTVTVLPHATVLVLPVVTKRAWLIQTVVVTPYIMIIMTRFTVQQPTRLVIYLKPVTDIRMESATAATLGDWRRRMAESTVATTMRPCEAAAKQSFLFWLFWWPPGRRKCRRQPSGLREKWAEEGWEIWLDLEKREWGKQTTTGRHFISPNWIVYSIHKNG